jgi:hypothetical protein
VGKENVTIFSRNHETFKVEQSWPVGADGYDKSENRPRGWRYLDGRPHHNFRISIRHIPRDEEKFSIPKVCKFFYSTMEIVSTFGQ